MISIINLGRMLMASGLTGLSLVGFAFGDFVRKWEPVPAALPGHDLLVWVSNLLLLLLGLGLLWRRTARHSALALSVFISLWILLLQVPVVAAVPAKAAIVFWGYLCGDWAVVMGALTLWAVQVATASPTSQRPVSPQKTARLARRLFALPLFLFGTSHLLFATQLAAIVPLGLPFPTQVVYFTGGAYIAAGAAMLLGILDGLAATLVAAMMSSFVILVDLFHVLAMPSRQATLTGFFFEMAMVGAAWIVAGSFRSLSVR